MKNMPTDKHYTIFITDSAFDDLDKIYTYIKNTIQMPDTAKKQIERIKSALLKLEYYPLSCNLTTDKVLRQKGYRKLVVDNYIVFYLVYEKKQKVNIMRIIYGAQKYESIL